MLSDPVMTLKEKDINTATRGKPSGSQTCGSAPYDDHIIL
jgi:hypothetical protein